MKIIITLRRLSSRGKVPPVKSSSYFDSPSLFSPRLIGLGLKTPPTRGGKN